MLQSFAHALMNIPKSITVHIYVHSVRATFIGAPLPQHLLLRGVRLTVNWVSISESQTSVLNVEFVCTVHVWWYVLLVLKSLMDMDQISCDTGSAGGGST